MQFDGEADTIAFDPALLALPIATAEPVLAGVLDRYVAELLARRGGLLDRVRCAVAETLRGAEPTLDATGARLKIGARTLQRKLAEHGTSHTAVIDEVRRTLAATYVTDPELALPEVTFLLGYSEPAAFYRAFKRWYGVAPAAYRSGARG